MRRARAAILAHGGAANSQCFHARLLALFGAVPWRGVPVMPVEIMLLPRWFPFHLTKISYWSRTVLTPLMVVTALKPRARNPRNVAIGELFVEPPDAGSPLARRAAAKISLDGAFCRCWTRFCAGRSLIFRNACASGQSIRPLHSSKSD